VPYLSALEVRSRRGDIQIHVYLYLYLYLYLYFTLLCCGLVGGGGSCRLFVGVTLAHLRRCSTRKQSFYLQQIFGEICLSALSAESIACMIFALVEDFRCISEWVNRSSISSLVGAILAYWQITVG